LRPAGGPGRPAALGAAREPRRPSHRDGRGGGRERAARVLDRGRLDGRGRLVPALRRRPRRGDRPHPMTAVVAIDGPSGAGKSTVARGVAAALGVEVLDTGAMYRAVTFVVLDAGVDPNDADACAALTRHGHIEQQGTTTRLDGRDVSTEIRSPAVTRAVSTVAAHPAVRAVLVEHQRRWAATHGEGVVEGRDIGTVVFPDAVLKVFLTASDT